MRRALHLRRASSLCVLLVAALLLLSGHGARASAPPRAQAKEPVRAAHADDASMQLQVMAAGNNWLQLAWDESYLYPDRDTPNVTFRAGVCDATDSANSAGCGDVTTWDAGPRITEQTWQGRSWWTLRWDGAQLGHIYQFRVSVWQLLYANQDDCSTATYTQESPDGFGPDFCWFYQFTTPLLNVDFRAPAAPDGLRADRFNGNTGIGLRWNDNDVNQTTQEVSVTALTAGAFPTGPVPEPFSYITSTVLGTAQYTLGAHDTSYMDYDAREDSDYVYSVAACLGDPAISRDLCSDSTPYAVDYRMPGGVQNLAVQSIADDRVVFSWDSLAGVTGYDVRIFKYIEHGLGGQPGWEQIVAQGVNAPVGHPLAHSWAWTSPAFGEQLYASVSGCLGDVPGAGANSPLCGPPARVDLDLRTPPAPTNLQIAQTLPNALLLTWQDNATTEQHEDVLAAAVTGSPGTLGTPQVIDTREAGATSDVLPLPQGQTGYWVRSCLTDSDQHCSALGGPVLYPTSTASLVVTSTPTPPPGSLLPFSVVPTLSLSGPTVGTVGLPLTFTATVSNPPSGGYTITWTFGDGSPAQRGGIVSHSWASTGSYTVVATLTAPSGATATASLAVSILAFRPAR